jgi:putative flippase GtrA
MSALSKTKKQLLPFAAVGIVATTSHLLLVTLLVNFLLFEPLIANMIAYGITINISYFGHKYYTFAGLEANKTLRFPHFLLISITGFALNECLYFLSFHW